MPVFPHDYLEKMTFHIYVAEGVPEDEARTVARHQVWANLVGHDSHGVIHITEYVERIHKGHIVPGAPFEIEHETPTTARINGNWGFGFVVTERAMGMAIQKAKANGVSAMTIRYQSHIGRLGAYPTMAAAEGMIGMITADSGRGPKSVAPFGGRERRLGTNPICMAMPSDLEGTVLLDMATSAVAGGKVSLARNRREQVPLGWIIDKDGNPTTDPMDQAQGGAILPLGGDQGHKGYGLSFMVETLSAVLTGLGFGIDPQGKHNDGCFLACFDVNAFRPLDVFKKDLKEFGEYVKQTPPAKGFTEVLYPGEIEHKNEQQRRRDGIYIEDDTWSEIWELVEHHKLEQVIGQP